MKTATHLVEWKPESFRAAILEKANAPLVVDEITTCEQHGLWYGEHLLSGQVFVKVSVSGICGAQLQEIRGEKGNVDHMPHLLGHEGCGIVVRTGHGVTRVKPGDKVVMHWRAGAGIEADFPKYKRGDDFVGGGRVTTLSEYAICSENRLTPVPADTPDDLCALLGCGLSTALGTIESEAKVKFGESVLIVGAGGLGANLIRCACMAHAHPIDVADVLESKRKTVKALGATRYFNSAENELKDAGKYDVIIDTSGAGMETALPHLAPSGRFVMVGQPKPGATVKMTCAAHMFEGEGKTIKATQGGGFNPSRDIPRYVSLWRAGLLDTSGIITKRMPLAKINDALDLVRAGQASRILIDMSL